MIYSFPGSHYAAVTQLFVTTSGRNRQSGRDRTVPYLVALLFCMCDTRILRPLPGTKEQQQKQFKDSAQLITFSVSYDLFFKKVAVIFFQELLARPGRPAICAKWKKNRVCFFCGKLLRQQISSQLHMESANRSVKDKSNMKEYNWDKEREM